MEIVEERRERGCGGRRGREKCEDSRLNPDLHSPAILAKPGDSRLNQDLYSPGGQAEPGGVRQ